MNKVVLVLAPGALAPERREVPDKSVFNHARSIIGGDVEIIGWSGWGKNKRRLVTLGDMDGRPKGLPGTVVSSMGLLVGTLVICAEKYSARYGGSFDGLTVEEIARVYFAVDRATVAPDGNRYPMLLLMDHDTNEKEA